MLIHDIIKDIVTAKDGVSYDVGRISWVVSTVAIIGAAVYMLIEGKFVNLMDLGGALGANTAAHGAAIGLKKGTEPE